MHEREAQGKSLITFMLVPSILYSYLMFMASTLQYRFLSSECSSVLVMFCKVLTWYISSAFVFPS
ncbi:hypothetical protein NC651_010863 [Populus alba x Populus x berolinensis]|nr:hypothetical protein NC651_010863 [Populus alba x Populus x berolinensis]